MRSGFSSVGCLDSVADLNSEEMERVIEAHVSQPVLHSKDCAFVCGIRKY